MPQAYLCPLRKFVGAVTVLSFVAGMRGPTHDSLISGVVTRVWRCGVQRERTKEFHMHELDSSLASISAWPELQRLPSGPRSSDVSHAIVDDLSPPRGSWRTASSGLDRPRTQGFCTYSQAFGYQCDVASGSFDLTLWKTEGAPARRVKPDRLDRLTSRQSSRDACTRTPRASGTDLSEST